jgi:hypothetical protein
MTRSRGIRKTPYRRWTAAEDAQLRCRYPHESSATLAAALGCSVARIYSRAANLGLRKSVAYLASPAACRLRRGDNIGAATRFTKGHVSANKGLRRPGYAPGRMAETQFKKGAMAGAAQRKWVPIGTEVLDADGYRKRKVADDRAVASRFNWRYVHVLVWEDAHGPLPAGHAVVFRNGDRTDIRLDNLERISRQDLMRRNTMHNYPKPITEAYQLIGAIRRQINRRARREEQDRRPA